jgi:hypothetical protein
VSKRATQSLICRDLVSRSETKSSGIDQISSELKQEGKTLGSKTSKLINSIRNKKELSEQLFVRIAIKLTSNIEYHFLAA